MVDPSTADYLRSDGLRVVAQDAGAAAFGDMVVESSIRSPLTTEAGAADEAARQIDFLKGPRAIDVLRVAGRRVDLIGRVVTLTATSQGYGGGAAVFVIDVDEIDGDDASLLTVIRRMT